jgi:hypothetical protein
MEVIGLLTTQPCPPSGPAEWQVSTQLSRSRPGSGTAAVGQILPFEHGDEDGSGEGFGMPRPGDPSAEKRAHLLVGTWKLVHAAAVTQLARRAPPPMAEKHWAASHSRRMGEFCL